MRRPVLLVCAVIGASCTAARTPAANPSPLPLVVVIVVDQMRTDYLERGQPHFTGGLARLTREGAWFHEAAYPYLNTVTCAGHSTIGTGSLPYRHGMVLNAWWDRETGRQRTCTFDPTVQNIGFTGTPTGRDSARSLLAPTLASRLRAERNGRVVGISLKPRSVIPLVGTAPASVLWYEDQAGWTTSTAFSPGKSEWAEKFITAHPVLADAGKVWERTLPLDAYQGPDEGTGERFPQGWTRTFPHVVTSSGTRFVAQWQRSPFADEYLGRMAAAAVDALGLGRGTGTDFLAISFSSLDLVGHQFGPVSHEVQDMVIRLDRTIGALLEHLDRTVGRGRYVAALSADHGVGPLPEQTPDGGRQTGDQALAAIDAALLPILGAGKHAVYAAYTDLYLAPGVMDELRGNPKAVIAVLDALKRLPGVAHAFLADEIAAPGTRTHHDPIKRAAALNYHASRSGDLLIVPKPGWMFSGTSAATHGTLYWHDQRVPIIFYGAGVEPGRRSGAATPADIAPTLGALAGITFATADGKPLIGPPASR